VLSANRVPGQEPVNEQDTFKYSIFLGAFSSNQKDPSFKMAPDAPKASAVHKGDQVAILIPDEAFTEEKFSKVSDKEVTPLGQIWLRELTPQVDGKPVESDKLRTVTIPIGKEPLVAQLYYAGLQKNSKGEVELVVYGTGKEVLARPVFASHEEQGAKPVMVGMEAPEEKPMLVTVSLFGKHRVKMEVAGAGK
jgi:hypothetical protein